MTQQNDIKILTPEEFELWEKSSRHEVSTLDFIYEVFIHYGFSREDDSRECYSKLPDIQKQAISLAISESDPDDRSLMPIENSKHTSWFDLTDEQKKAIDLCTEAIKSSTPVFRVGGYAGTGKTTILKHIIKNLSDSFDCLPCAFTGKAALRMRSKGISCSTTIHSTIYNYDRKAKKFYLKTELPGDYFLVDESSMMNSDLWEHMKGFDLPILLVGDPGQLEPVGKDPGLMINPDYVLNKIHRQAENSGIVQFATDVRLSTPVRSCYDCVYFGRPDYSDQALKWADIIICGFNNTRVQINESMRRIKGFSGMLCEGESIIILRNNYSLGVFNGQILTVKQIRKDCGNVLDTICLDDKGDELELKILKNFFGVSKPDQDISPIDYALADYGYCITCHKSQGSEWDKVIVFDEQCSVWEPKRWRYTAITRAAQELVYFSGRKI